MDLLPLGRTGALAALQGRGLSAWWRGLRHGPLVEVRMVSVPYRVFEVRVTNAGREERSWLAIDALTGGLDPYRFDRSPAPEGLAGGEAGPVCTALVPPARLRDILLDRIRRQVYARGFFRLRDLRIEVDDTGRLLRLPYWAGLHRKGDRVWVDVVGGLRSDREGAKARDAVATLLGLPSPQAVRGANG